MSFRDVRDLLEQLKLIGFTDKIPVAVLNTNYGSLEAFRTYAGILQWLVTRLDPSSGAALAAATRLRSESDRVAFIRAVSEFMVLKAGVKVNPKKLYASSAVTAKEILKITSLLSSSNKEVDNDKFDEEIRSLQDVDLSDKVDELRRVRELSSELTKRGAILYDLLAKEQINKEVRNSQTGRPLELATVERHLKAALSNLESTLEQTKTRLEASKTEKNNLAAKLQRKTSELERSRQRLQALQKVRPAYLEEYERLEQELKSLFDQYITRVRCIDALKAQLASRDTTFESPSSPIAKITDGSMTILPEGLIDSDEEEEEMENGDLNLKEEAEVKPTNREELLNRARSSTRLRGRTGVAIRGGTDSNLIGSMTGEVNNLDSSLGSDDSESELDLNGDLGTIADLQSDEDDILLKMRTESRDANRNSKADLSDEDF